MVSAEQKNFMASRLSGTAFSSTYFFNKMGNILLTQTQFSPLCWQISRKFIQRKNIQKYKTVCNDKYFFKHK